MSTGCQKTTASQVIPTTRRVTINEGDHMPHDYSTTPGGTLFSTTPGGTRIIYDRNFLLKCRSSPVARAPPVFLPDIPGVTSPSKRIITDPAQNGEPMNNNNIIITDKLGADDDQFEMDI